MNAARKPLVLLTLLITTLLVPQGVFSEDAKDQLSSADREYRNTLLALGDRQLDSGQMNEALETFAVLVNRFPDDPVLFTRIGHVYLKKQEWDLAQESFVRAKELDKEMVEAYVGLGLVYAESPAKGMSAYYNFRRAVAEAKRATKLDPNYGPA